MVSGAWCATHPHTHTISWDPWNSKCTMHNFSHHHPQHFPDSVVEGRVFDGCLDLDGMLSFLHGDDDEWNGSRWQGPDTELLAEFPVFRGRAAHMLHLNQVHAHLNRSTIMKKVLCSLLELISICWLSLPLFCGPSCLDPAVQTHSDEIGAVVVEDGFNFKLLSTDRRVGQLQIDEEVLPDNDLQGVTNADAWKKRSVWKTKHQEGEGGVVLHDWDKDIFY